MFQEQRPTCVTVIGWAWIIIGGMMCLSATMALSTTFLMSGLETNSSDSAFIHRVFPVIALVQIGFGALGAVSGYRFLELKESARTELEALTWLLLISVMGFMVFWEYGWYSMAMQHEPGGFGMLGAIMGLVISGIYAVPLVIMLKTLRGPKVKDAIQRMVACPHPDEKVSTPVTRPNSGTADPET